jgi:hypothetical protein
MSSVKKSKKKVKKSKKKCPLSVDTLGRLYDDFIRLLVFQAHREASSLSNELP